MSVGHDELCWYKENAGSVTGVIELITIPKPEAVQQHLPRHLDWAIETEVSDRCS